MPCVSKVTGFVLFPLTSRTSQSSARRHVIILITADLALTSYRPRTFPFIWPNLSGKLSLTKRTQCYCLSPLLSARRQANKASGGARLYKKRLTVTWQIKSTRKRFYCIVTFLGLMKHSICGLLETYILSLKFLWVSITSVSIFDWFFMVASYFWTKNKMNQK